MRFQCVCVCVPPLREIPLEMLVFKTRSFFRRDKRQSGRREGRDIAEISQAILNSPVRRCLLLLAAAAALAINAAR